MADLDLFHCEAFACDMQASACLVNQARGELEGSLSTYFKCLTCDVGKLLREANGGELPELKMSPTGTPIVVGGNLSAQARRLRREKKMGKHAVKVDGEPVTLPGGAPLTASTPAAAARIAESLTPSRADAKLRKKKEKQKVQGAKMPTEKKAKVPVVVPTAPTSREAGAAKIMCRNHPDRPGHKHSGLCLACHQAKLANIPPEKIKEGQRNGGLKVKKAYEIFRQHEAGELIALADRFKPVFELVPELQGFLEAQAKQNLRTLEAEVAFRLRQDMEEQLNPKQQDVEVPA